MHRHMLENTAMPALDVLLMVYHITRCKKRKDLQSYPKCSLYIRGFNIGFAGSDTYTLPYTNVKALRYKATEYWLSKPSSLSVFGYDSKVC